MASDSKIDSLPTIPSVAPSDVFAIVDVSTNETDKVTFSVVESVINIGNTQGNINGSRVSGNISGDSGGITSTLPVSLGGTGQTSANPALNALLPSQTSNTNKFLQTNGTDSSWATPTIPLTVSSGKTTKDISSATTTTIPHGLGAIPAIVRIKAVRTENNSVAGTNISKISMAESVITGGVANSIYSYMASQSAYSANGSSSINGEGFKLFHYFEGTLDRSITGTITVDSTNINITWSLTSTPTGTANILWEAIK